MDAHHALLTHSLNVIVNHQVVTIFVATVIMSLVMKHVTTVILMMEMAVQVLAKLNSIGVVEELLLLHQLVFLSVVMEK